jgi:hypothetical protein
LIVRSSTARRPWYARARALFSSVSELKSRPKPRSRTYLRVSALEDRVYPSITPLGNDDNHSDVTREIPATRDFDFPGPMPLSNPADPNSERIRDLDLKSVSSPWTAEWSSKHT